jgi:predicted nucleotidyltransferase
MKKADIKDKRLQDIVRKILAADDPDKIVLYGSRARRENSSRSDFDIAVFGKVNIGRIWNALQEADTLLKIDLVAFSDLTNAALKTKILNEGVVLYERKV